MAIKPKGLALKMAGLESALLEVFDVEDIARAR